MKKRFVVRKYVMAESAAEAIKSESTFSVDEVFVDEEWLKKNPEEGSKLIGFTNKKQ